VVFSFLVTALVGPFQTDQARECRGVPILQAESGVRRKVAQLFAGMVVVIARECERAKDTVDADAETAFAILARL
jgi:hypothetical protein